MAMKSTLTTGTVQCQGLDTRTLRCQHICPPLLLYDWCKCQHSEKGNYCLSIMMKSLNFRDLLKELRGCEAPLQNGVNDCCFHDGYGPPLSRNITSKHITALHTHLRRFKNPLSHVLKIPLAESSVNLQVGFNQFKTTIRVYL